MCCWSNPWERVEREEEEEGSVDEDDMKLDRQRERVRGGGERGEPKWRARPAEWVTESWKQI